MNNPIKVRYQHSGMPPLDGSMKITVSLYLEEEIEVSLKKFHEPGFKKAIVRQLTDALIDEAKEL